MKKASVILTLGLLTGLGSITHAANDEALKQAAKENLQKQFFKDVQKNDKKNLEIDIQRGADLNAKDENGNTALGIAVSFGFFEIVQELIKSKADINVQDKDGLTALMIAIRKEQPKIARFLLAKKADLNKKDSTGKTALDYAKESSNSEIKKLLPELEVKTKKEKKKTWGIF